MGQITLRKIDKTLPGGTCLKFWEILVQPMVKCCSEVRGMSMRSVFM